MKHLILLLVFVAACGSTKTQTAGNSPIPTPTPSMGLTYMGVCNQTNGTYFQSDAASNQTWSVGGPPIIEQGICQTFSR